MSEEEAIATFKSELKEYLETGVLTHPELLLVFRDQYDRLYIHSNRNDGYVLGIVEKYAIRIRPSTVYMDVWREFSKRTKRRIYLAENLRVPSGRNRIRMTTSTISPSTLNTDADLRARNEEVVVVVDPTAFTVSPRASYVYTESETHTISDFDGDAEISAINLDNVPF